jgi:hypothetical protein
MKMEKTKIKDEPWSHSESVSEEEKQRIRNVLEGAIALHEENPEKGDVYLFYGTSGAELLVKTKIIKIIGEDVIIEGGAVFPKGDRFPLWHIKRADMVDEASEEDVVEAEKKIEK